MNTIQDIRASTDAGTDTEVIKRALKLYKIVVASQQEGSQLTLRDNEGKDHQLIIL